MGRRGNLSRWLAILLLLTAGTASADDKTDVMYLANEGVMVSRGDTRILFDPLFNESFGQYQLVPDTMRAAILAGEAPFDGIDAVFISHYHDDHFSVPDMLRLLRAREDLRVYAPAQAVTAIRLASNDGDQALLARLVGLDLAYGDAPLSIEADGFMVDAVHVPHAGWPDARTDVQNIAFRITIDGDSTVLHLGDADPSLVHFENDAEYWSGRAIDLALPPYWFFGSAQGREIIDDRLDAARAIGIHVPARFVDPENIPAGLAGFELFTRPGERRSF